MPGGERPQGRRAAECQARGGGEEAHACRHKHTSTTRTRTRTPPYTHTHTYLRRKLDIDYTLFDLGSAAERPDELARPYLHEFLKATYQYYDIIICASGAWGLRKNLTANMVSSSPARRLGSIAQAGLRRHRNSRGLAH